MFGLEFLDSGDQLLHVGDRPDEDLELEFLLLAALLSIAAFLVLFVRICVFTKTRRYKSTKRVEGLVDFCATSLLDSRVVLPAKRVACRPGDFAGLPRPTLGLGGGRRSGNLVVVRIVVALEFVRLRGNIFGVRATFLRRVRRLCGRSDRFGALDPVGGEIEGGGGHGIEQKGVSDCEEEA